MNSQEIKKLFEITNLAKEEFEIIICSFMFWRKLYEKRENEDKTHEIMRTLFFREVILGTTRIWNYSNKNTQSLSIFKVKIYLQDKRIWDVLIKNCSHELSTIFDRIDSFTIFETYEEKLRSLQDYEKKNTVLSQNICSIISKYENEDREIIDSLKKIRDKLIAHRDIGYKPEDYKIIDIVQKIYVDTALIIKNLMDILGSEEWNISGVENLYRNMANSL